MSNNEEHEVIISAEVDLTDKQRAMELFDDLGLNLSTAINIFIKKSIAEGGLPFEIEDPFYGEANQAELNRRFKKIAGDRD